MSTTLTGLSDEQYVVSVIDMLGRTVLQTNIRGANPTLDLRGITSGVYTVLLHSGAHRERLSLVVR
ncbi:MAG: T9SS type A sorting domain-containing protein [Bacteroidetes bacterium]|nr:T9SS type A sorting domain-containing protein [Bacteroidota bacterium]